MGANKNCQQASQESKKFIKRLSFVAVISFVLLATIKTVFAAPVAAGITVTPAVEQLNLHRGQISAQFTITLTNNTPYTATFSASAQDFTAQGINGSLRFVPNADINTTNPHGLSNYLQFSNDQITISPGKSQSEVVTIAHADQLAPGGHYGAVVFKSANPSTQINNNVAINEAVSSLVFVRTHGGGTQSLAIAPLPIKSFVSSFPTNQYIVLTNIGNTQTTPRGYIQVSNNSGKLLAQTLLNINSGLLLPNTKRLFQVTLNPTTQLNPGYYHIKVFYRYDGEQNYQLYTKTFFLLDTNFIVGVIASILAVLLTIILLINHAFNRRKRKNVLKVAQPNQVDTPKKVIRTNQPGKKKVVIKHENKSEDDKVVVKVTKKAPKSVIKKSAKKPIKIAVK